MGLIFVDFIKVYFSAFFLWVRKQKNNTKRTTFAIYLVRYLYGRAELVFIIKGEVGQSFAE